MDNYYTARFKSLHNNFNNINNNNYVYNSVMTKEKKNYFNHFHNKSDDFQRNNDFNNNLNENDKNSNDFNFSFKNNSIENNINSHLNEIINNEKNLTLEITKKK